jgi:uncharacterized protein YggE
MEYPMRRIAAALIPFALAAALAAPAMAQQVTVTPGIITIEGMGEVVARPDMAIVTSGVTSQGATAREALTANTADMAKLIETLKAAGIEDRDIQTSGFSVNPNYVYSNEVDANGYSLPPKVNGYIVSNQVTIRVRDLAKLGAVLDQSVTVGANTINGISFSVADTDDLYTEARKQAFADARAKAELYAETAGVELGDIAAITEAQGYGVPQPYLMRDMAMSAAAPVPVEAGELSFTINVSVSWQLDQE